MNGIPEYKSRAPLNRPTNEALFTEAKLEQQIGQAVTSTLGSASEMVFKAQMAEEEIQKRTYVAERELNLKSTMRGHEDRILKEYAFKPEKAPEAIDAVFKQELNKLAKGAPFPRAEQEFRFSAEQYGIGVRDKMTTWKHNQQIKNLEFANDHLAKDQAVNVYRNPFDKQVYEENQWTMSQLANQFDVTMDPQLVNKKNRAYRQLGATTRFQSIIDKAMTLAQNGKLNESDKMIKTGQEMLDSKDFDYDLGADGLAKVSRQMKFAKRKKATIAKNFEMLKSIDPYKYLEKRGIVFPAIDFNNLAESVSQRKQLANQASQRFGMVTPLLHKGDVAVFNRLLDEGNPEKLINSFKTMAGADEETRRDLVMALSKNDMSSAYLLNGLASGSIDESAAEEVLAGRKLLKKDKVTGVSGVVMPKTNEVQSYVDNIIGTRLSDPDQKKAASTIVMQALAARRSGQEDLDTDLNEDDEEAIDNIVQRNFGPATEWNGTQFFGPAQATSDQVENVLNNISDAKLESFVGSVPVSESGQPIGLEKNRGDLTLEPTSRKGVFQLKFKGQQLYFKQKQKGQPKVPYQFNLEEYFNKESDDVKNPKGWFQRMFD